MFSIHRKLLLALKKVRIVKSTPPQVPSLSKKIPPSKISDSSQPMGGIFPPTPYRHLENPEHLHNVVL